MPAIVVHTQQTRGATRMARTVLRSGHCAKIMADASLAAQCCDPKLSPKAYVGLKAPEPAGDGPLMTTLCGPFVVEDQPIRLIRLARPVNVIHAKLRQLQKTSG